MASLQGEPVFDERPHHFQAIRRRHREPKIEVCIVHFLE
jgi:hypothetical protein